MATTAKKITKHNFETIREAGKAALEQTDGDWQAAIGLLHEWIDSDADLYKQLLEPLLDNAIYSVISSVARSDRQRFKLHTCSGSDNTKGLHSMAKQQKLDWLDYRLRGGKKLGDATKEDLLVEIEDCETNANSLTNKARWFKKIKRKMGKTGTVRKAMNSATVQKLAEDSQYV